MQAEEQAAGTSRTIATSDGTATAPGDYASNTGTVSFAPNDTSETVTVQVNGDTAVEPDETFNVDLSNATGGGATIADDQGVGTITDDDAAPTAKDGDIDVIINGPTRSRASDKTVVAKVSNVGQDTFEVSTPTSAGTSRSTISTRRVTCRR